MNLFGRDIQGHPTVLVILAAVLLVAGGLCGVQVAILDSRMNGVDNLYMLFALTGVLEIGVMLIALMGIVVVLIAWAISHFFLRDDEAQRNITQHPFQVTSESDELEKRSPDPAQDDDG